ncbi:hypothetical protein PR202_gb03023 [Eleusine coracana subsp. coracana]|uniref:RBR-type E3 ubiquitin transferase n=1 Tax=Eleusine coracana subsp. coracana TaxID=191504 RepID=A0AAV5E0R9_ELECO|nr:hypothetical protein PR202_gb03023 [Eleusine coracana subsp. coracana]
MEAGSSSSSGGGGDLTGLVDEFYFSALAHGRNDADAAGDDELFPISDEKYAAELQLQEVILSSVVAATSTRLSPPLRYISSSSASASITANAVAEDSLALALVPVVGKGKCSITTSTIASSLSSGPSMADDAATLVFCKICMDAVPAGDAHRASRGCAHAFCGGCLARYLGAKVRDRIADVRCPEERCGGALDPELCQGLIPAEVFERWGAALCESMVLGARKTYCPYKDCSAMMVVEEDGVVVEEAECPSCRRLFCARCGVAPWHAGVDCADYGKVRNSRREDMLLIEMAKGKKWKRCPKCDFFVEKRDGCLHITCRCGFEFCYGCGAKWGITHSTCTTA